MGRIICTLWIFGYPLAALAQPNYGDVFREYRWTNEDGDAGGSLRVGGRLDYGGSPIEMPQYFDLRHAIRAEIVVEKLLCHAGTRELAISVNGNPWMAIPEAAEIPKSQWDYQHHVYPVAVLPLSQLREGSKNQFRLRVGEEPPPNWPQHLIYGVHFRIYYNPERKPHPNGQLISPKSNEVIGKNATVEVEVDGSHDELRQVDFLGLYEGVNLEGDGQYRQWHYHYFRAELTGHIGSRAQPPWTLDWDTTWIPNQDRPFQLAARLTDRNGITYQTRPVSGLTFKRDGLTVELCKPYDVPKKWVTRSAEHTEKFRVVGDLRTAVAARLVWCSWSPGYMEGIFVNGQKVLECEGPRYAYFIHRVPLEDLSMLRPGENLLSTGKTSRRDGTMVHGMEVNWPGIMVLIQYQQ